MTPRAATPADIVPLARLWHSAWHEAHADHVPSALTRLRTHHSFAFRLAEQLPAIICAGPLGRPVGFCLPKEAEIYQMFVAPEARGTGAAARLITAGEDAIRAAGHARAHLDVIPQNTRAIRFYERMGWRKDQLQISSLDTSDGPFDLECLLMIKDL